MKTILIIGDSWGVPNYAGPGCGAEPHEHTEYLLRRLGYKVYNCALNGSSNSASIMFAREYLSGKLVTLEPKHVYSNYHKVNAPEFIDKINPKIDYVIWFHTESLRYHFKNNLTIEENLVQGYEQEYQYASSFFKQIRTKPIIIGGQAPIYYPLFYKYFPNCIVIPDWRSEIVNKKLPSVYWLTHTRWIEESKDDKDTKLKYLADSKIVFDAMQTSTDFIDNCHPASIPHKNLTDWLHTIFKNNGEVAQTVRAMDS